jgi:ABC-type microcin C transport system permease subunit YejB
MVPFPCGSYYAIVVIAPIQDIHGDEFAQLEATTTVANYPDHILKEVVAFSFICSSYINGESQNCFMRDKVRG